MTEQENKEIEQEVVDEILNEEVLDYDKGLVTKIASLPECKKFNSSQNRKHPILIESPLWDFIIKIRIDRYTSPMSNVPDQLPYRSINTIKSEATSLAFWFVNVSPNPRTLFETDTLELIRVVTNSPGKKKNSLALPATIFSRIRALMFFADLFPLETGLKRVARKAKIDELNLQAEAFQVMAEQDQKEKRDAKDLPRTFQEVLEKVERKFGVNSKQYIVFALYAQIPVRDNFGDLRIVDQAHIDNESKENYLVLKPEGRLRVIILDHKTRNLYGDLGTKLSLHLSHIIRHYILTKNLHVQDYLFGSGKKLSPFVKETFTAVGYPGLTINAIREIYENENASLPLVERAKLARLAGHSLQTARNNYVTRHAEQQVADVQQEIVNQNVENEDRLVELNEKLDNLTDNINKIKDHLKIR